MATFDFLKNLFRPTWRHTDPEVRADAVRQMDERDGARLSEIARTDDDVRVRRIAVKKLVDTDTLADLAGSEPDDSLRKAIAEKLTDLLVSHATSEGDAGRAALAVSRLVAPRALADVARSAPQESVRFAAVQKLTDAKALLDVAKNARDSGTRLAALARIGDGAALRELAIHEPTKEIGLAALERLSDEGDLQAVFKRAKNKTVREAARERLGLSSVHDRSTTKSRVIGDKAAAQVADATPEARRRARQVQLCASVEKLAVVTDLAEGIAALTVAEQQWRDAGAGDPDLQKRFERAVERFQARRAAHEETLAARERAVRAEEEAQRKKLGLAAGVEALDGDDIPKRVDDARAAWKAAGSVPAAGHAELEQRFAAATSAALKRHEQGKSRQAIRSRQEALVAEAEALGLPERMPSADKKLPSLQREWRELAAASPPDEPMAQRFTAIADQITGHISSLRAEEKARSEAENAHNLARLEELAAQLEALAETEDRKTAEQTLKTAQSAFESVGPVGKEQQAEVRRRFQAARDKLAGRIQDLRDAEHWKRWANVPRLESLVARAEALRDNTAIEAKDLGPALKALQTEWKGVGPAPKEKSEALWARFKEAGDQIYKRKGEQAQNADNAEKADKPDENRGENLTKKQELCVQVAALADAPLETMSWKETAEQIKAIQEQWKAIGPVPKEDADALWKRFRESCDKFFAARKEHLGKVGEERGDNLKKKEELVAQVEKLAGSSIANTNWKETADQIKLLQDEWKNLGPVPKEQADAVWKRFREACDKFFDRRKEHFGRLDEERAANLKKKEHLCVEIEALAANEDNIEGKGREAAITQVKQLQAQWKRTGPAPKEQADAIWKRFRETCDKFFQSPDKAGAADNESGEYQLATPEELANQPRFENRLPLDSLQPKPDRSEAGDQAEPPYPAGPPEPRAGTEGTGAEPETPHHAEAAKPAGGDPVPTPRGAADATKEDEPAKEP